MSFKKVDRISTKEVNRIRFFTRSGSVYELGPTNNPSLKREVKKAGVVLGKGILYGVAEYPENLDLSRSGGVFAGSSILPDDRVIAHMEDVMLGDCLGIMLDGKTTGGIGSTPIVKIEVEK